MGQSLDPETLIKKAEPRSETKYDSGRTIDNLPLDQRLTDRIRKKGFERLTPIQDQSLEPLIQGQNLMGIAQTGTGKTGAFLIPVIHRLLTEPNRHQALVLVPTRELALQVQEEFDSLSQGLGLRRTTLIGGTSLHTDRQRLKKGNHVIIGTPGRVQDHIDNGGLRLHTFTTFILDEFDRMLDMGFIRNVNRIHAEMKNLKQTVLFSATESASQRKDIDRLLRNPVEVRVSSGNRTSDHIEQDVVRIMPGEDKFSIMLNLIQQDGFERVLVFEETKRSVSKLALKLKKAGVSVDEIHGNKTQASRKRALDKFRAGNIKVLVATDVAARGIDVDDVSHVINYRVPVNRESYIHRIGRTGRAGRQGIALTLVD